MVDQPLDFFVSYTGRDEAWATWTAHQWSNLRITDRGTGFRPLGKRRIFQAKPASPRAERRRTTGTSGDKMLKARILRTGFSVVAIAGLAGGLSLAAGGTTLAAAQQRTQSVTSRVLSAPKAVSMQKVAKTASLDYTCYFPLSGFYCAAHVFSGAPLFKSSGALYQILPSNDTVHVTCYYSGNPPKPYKGDGYQDHVVWENIPNPISGHVPDHYVNFDNQTPGQVGIPPC